MLFHKNKCIVIVDYGPLGAALTKSLYKKGHKVMVLDKDRESFRYLPGEFRGYEVEEDPTDPQVLGAAGIGDAGLFIASAQDNNTDLLLARIAGRIFHVSQVYTRLGGVGGHQLAMNLPVKPISLYGLSADDYGRLAETVDREVAV